MSSEADSGEERNPVLDWARTTMLFAVQIRAVADGNPVTRERIEQVATECEETIYGLWNQARDLVGEDQDPAFYVLKFTELVFSWCSEHRFGK